MSLMRAKLAVLILAAARALMPSSAEEVVDAWVHHRGLLLARLRLVDLLTEAGEWLIPVD